MTENGTERSTVEGAVSETQKQLLEMRPGERWAHEAANRVDRVGGNQGEFTLAQAGGPGEVTPTEELPQRIQEGITERHEVTDRNLDFDDEFGYPTPT